MGDILSLIPLSGPGLPLTRISNQLAHAGKYCNGTIPHRRRLVAISSCKFKFPGLTVEDKRLKRLSLGFRPTREPALLFSMSDPPTRYGPTCQVQS